MCTNATMNTTTTTTPSSLQTFDRVKNYKVVGQVSNYARGLAEGSNLFNQYIAPISTKGLTAAAPYVPDVSSYVPTKYVEKADLLGVNCLERIENVSLPSPKKALSAKIQGVTDYVNKLMPVEGDKQEGDESEVKVSLKHRVYVNSKKHVDWLSSGVSGAITGVTTKVNKTVSPLSIKVQETIAPVTTKVNTIIEPVSSRATALVSNTQQKIAAVRKFREELTYVKVTDMAVASSSQVLSKTKTTTLAYVPSAYRDSVETTVSSTEARVAALWKRLPTAKEVRSLERAQVKQALYTVGSSIMAKAASPLYYISAKIQAPFVKNPVPGAETPEEFEAPEAVCVATSPEAETPEEFEAPEDADEDDTPALD